VIHKEIAIIIVVQINQVLMEHVGVE